METGCFKGECAVIFGGTGFIGSFFAKYIVEKIGIKKVYLYDLVSIESKGIGFRADLLSGIDGCISFVKGDVRESIEWIPEEKVALIANFAAVHREPGHECREYFETNILGAENVTKWAEICSCDNIVFTSSISPYGVSDEIKDESTLPVPVTPYGASKYAAEKIHLIWQAKSPENRKLIIVRPGVVFGPGEGGNVTRLVKAVRKGYFFYMGNRGTRKAGIYVKELCNSICWVRDLQIRNRAGVYLFNASMNPGPSIFEYVCSACRVLGVKRFVPSIPYFALLSVSYVIDFLSKIIGLNHPFSPVRIRKLVRSNNIKPGFLINSGYSYLYDLDSAMEDWKKEFPEDWK